MFKKDILNKYDFKKKLNKVFKFIKLLLKIFWIILLFSILLIFFALFKYSDLTENLLKSSHIESKINTSNIITPEKYRRWADQTFLTFPEWFLVFAPQSQANFLKENTNSNYPYFADTAWIWQSYKIMYDQINWKYNFNVGYHLMIFVIWTSSSIEYNLKSFYESTIWYLTDTKKNVTQEDKFYWKFANDYVNFIYDIPWYEFNFKKELEEFNSSTYFFWDYFIRKTERKIIINIELFVKYIYWKIIKSWTAWVYDPALPTTIVVIDKNPEKLINKEKLDLLKIKLFKKIKNNDKIYYLVSLPRYDKFKDYSNLLSENNINFIEIAWNSWDIVVSVLVEKDYDFNDSHITKLFKQKIITNKKYYRLVFKTKVSNLSKVLKLINNKNILLEHVFDY